MSWRQKRKGREQKRRKWDPGEKGIGSRMEGVGTKSEWAGNKGERGGNQKRRKWDPGEKKGWEPGRKV